MKIDKFNMFTNCINVSHNSIINFLCKWNSKLFLSSSFVFRSQSLYSQGERNRVTHNQMTEKDFHG